MPKLKDAYLQIQERHAREIKRRTSERLNALLDEERDNDLDKPMYPVEKNDYTVCLYLLCLVIILLKVNLLYLQQLFLPRC
jgi:hypothetical protein